jgi:enoyl-CoA hydratase/carnithine racemase
VLEITNMTALAIACPVVATVNGHALGGGFVLMLAATCALPCKARPRASA